MVKEILLFILLLLAVFAGWLLGRRSALPLLDAESTRSPNHYLSSLNRLLAGEKSDSVSSLTKILDDDQGGMELYLIIAALLRRRGEVDRAIECHQNLLARIDTESPFHGDVILELAKDYIHAGLYDRAEVLLDDLACQHPAKRVAALEAMLEIQQSSREWRKAVEVGNEILALIRPPMLFGESTQQNRFNALRCAMAHYHCELASNSLRIADYAAVRAELRQALKLDRKSVRASWLLAELEMKLGNKNRALRHLKRVRLQAPEWLADTAAIFLDRMQKLTSTSIVQQLLQDWLDYYPSPALIRVATEFVLRESGPHQAYAFFLVQLYRYQNLRPLLELLSRHPQPVAAELDTFFRVIKQLSDHFLEARSRYLCGHCGFAGKKAHWQCPSCKEWNSMKPIFGRDGEYL